MIDLTKIKHNVVINSNYERKAINKFWVDNQIQKQRLWICPDGFIGDADSYPITAYCFGVDCEWEWSEGVRTLDSKHSVLTSFDDFYDEFIAPPKPKTKIEYVKCEFNSAWEAVKAFEEGENLYTGTVNTKIMLDNYSEVADEVMNGSDIYRRVEREVTWQDDVIDSMDAISLNCTIAHLIDFSPETLIKLSGIIASRTDKPE